MAQILKMRMKTCSLKRNALPIAYCALELIAYCALELIAYCALELIAYCALKLVVAGAEKLIGEDRHVDLLLVDGRARRQRHRRAHLLTAGARQQSAKQPIVDDKKRRLQRTDL